MCLFPYVGLRAVLVSWKTCHFATVFLEFVLNYNSIKWHFILFRFCHGSHAIFRRKLLEQTKKIESFDSLNFCGDRIKWVLFLRLPYRGKMARFLPSVAKIAINGKILAIFATIWQRQISLSAKFLEKRGKMARFSTDKNGPKSCEEIISLFDNAYRYVTFI